MGDNGLNPARQWSWVGARSTGTSHLRDGSACDDAGSCLEVRAPGGASFVAAVSDGAGSASLSRFGSRIVVSEFCRAAAALLKRSPSEAPIEEDEAADWLDAIRDRIAFKAKTDGQSARSYASTLVGCVVQPTLLTVIHVGDGACVVKCAGEDEWIVPSWPSQGEYASSTYFVTDEPACRLAITNLGKSVSEMALFTDGLERLALDFAAKAAFRPFCETMFPALRDAAGSGRQRHLSRDLKAFLDSEAVVDRTDDDKTLIMARRSPGPPDGSEGHRTFER